MGIDITLSIIIPCYNGENHLMRCLNSLLNQDVPLDSYEIIIVDDGSTDGTPEICDLYSSKYLNISVISQSNGGIGAARNAGIRQAKGKYMMFVDADDYVDHNVLSILTNKIINSNLQALRFNYQSLDENLQIIPKKNNSTFSVVWDEISVDGTEFLTEKLGWSCYVWLYIFDTYLIRKNNLYFSEGVIFEDIDWLVRVLLVTQKIMAIDKQVYNYVQRVNSITQDSTLENKSNIVKDKIRVVNFLIELSQKTKNVKVELWCKGMISLTFMGILSFTENEFPERKNEIIRLLRRKKLLPLKSYHFTWKQKRDLSIINISPKIFCFIKRRVKINILSLNN